MSEPNPDFVHEKVQGIDVVTFRDRYPCCSSDRVRDRLCDLVDDGVERLILDLSNVELAGETFLAMLITLHRKLWTQMPLSGPWRPPFKICDDRKSALNVLSSESDPLVLCAVRSEIRHVFRLLRLWDGPD